MPPAARKTDVHTCPEHPPNEIDAPCCLSVPIGGHPAARVTDLCTCTAAMVEGSPSVLIGGHRAARRGDATVHGGEIATGCGSVIIGDFGQGPGPALTLALSRQLLAARTRRSNRSRAASWRCYPCRDA